MSELPRIAPTTPGAAIRPLKPTRGPERDPKRRREKRKERERDPSPPAADDEEEDEGDSGKGGGIDVRV